MGELFLQLNGLGAGAIRGKFDTYDIKVIYDTFINGVSADDIMNISIPTRAGNVLMGTIADYNFESAISKVAREDGNITVRVEADVDQ
jgi:multidrug efflux pump subunit AcrB